MTSDLVDRMDESGIREILEGVGSVFRGDAGGLFALVPSDLFDERHLPNVDLEPVLVDVDGERGVAFPFHRSRALRGGFYVLTNEHLAAEWYNMPYEALEWEYAYRREHDLAIPPYLEEAIAGGDDA